MHTVQGSNRWTDDKQLCCRRKPYIGSVSLENNTSSTVNPLLNFLPGGLHLYSLQLPSTLVLIKKRQGRPCTITTTTIILDVIYFEDPLLFSFVMSLRASTLMYTYTTWSVKRWRLLRRNSAGVAKQERLGRRDGGCDLGISYRACWYDSKVFLLVVFACFFAVMAANAGTLCRITSWTATSYLFRMKTYLFGECTLEILHFPHRGGGIGKCVSSFPYQ